jgi:hypothetical protein
MTFSRVLSLAVFAVALSINSATAQIVEMPGVPSTEGARTGGSGFGGQSATASPAFACQRALELLHEAYRHPLHITVAPAYFDKDREDSLEMCELNKASLANDAKLIQGLTENVTMCPPARDALAKAQQRYNERSRSTEQMCAPIEFADVNRAAVGALLPAKREPPFLAFDPGFSVPDIERAGHGSPRPPR